MTFVINDNKLSLVRWNIRTQRAHKIRNDEFRWIDGVHFIKWHFHLVWHWVLFQFYAYYSSLELSIDEFNWYCLPASKRIQQTPYRVHTGYGQWNAYETKEDKCWHEIKSQRNVHKIIAQMQLLKSPRCFNLYGKRSKATIRWPFEFKSIWFVIEME